MTQREVKTILEIVLSANRDLISFCWVCGKVGSSDHNITMNFCRDFKDKNMILPNFRLPKLDKMRRDINNVKSIKVLDVDTDDKTWSNFKK